MWPSIRALTRVGVFAPFSQRETWAVFRCPRRRATSFWESCCAVRYRQRRLVTARFCFGADGVTKGCGIYKEDSLLQFRSYACADIGGRICLRGQVLLAV